ncbi:hypothetical protein DL764_004644 [Monosporascus ibericus]|uniref:Uncharacterized protein n=1 Tax=Monosporascus ibericus TaxID=155417 RepID=A0A4Q4TBY5_9PEZI|nr:hypothetical protein DL764_004644 [Monosporascus ibericus]
MPSSKLNRRALEENSIFFFEKNDEYGQVPAHVSSLRDALLDFECTLPARLSFYDEDEFEDDEMLRSIMDKLFGSDSEERASTMHSIKMYREMKHDAQILDNGCDREAEWVKFYEKNFLDKLCEEFVITDQDSRRVARTKFYYDNFDVAKERQWSLFSGPGDFRKEHGKSVLTMPVPDWVAYFRVYDLKSSWGRIRNSSSRWPWANSAKNEIVENFSLATLQELAEHGLQFSVANTLRGNQNSSIVPSDLICYPWLITEYKRKDKEGNKEGNNERKMQCYCQAANAGAASLMLLQTLVRHSTYKTVLPVVTMTTWGPEVCIWICFFDDSLKRYQAFGDDHPALDPDAKVPLFKTPTPTPNHTSNFRLDNKTLDTFKESNHSRRTANTSNTGHGPATPRLELDSSNPEETTSGQTPCTPVSKHMFNSQTDWAFGTPSWVASAQTTLIDAQTGRPLETTGSRIDKPDPANGLTKANQTPELIKSDTHVLRKGPPSPAIQRSPATESLESKEAGRPVTPPDLTSFSKEPSTSAAEHGSGTHVSAYQSQSPPPDERPKVGLFEQSNSGNFKGGLFDGLDTNGWKPRSIPYRDEQRQLCSDSGPSKPTRGEPSCGCPSSSSLEQKGSRPSDASKAQVQASLSDGVKTSAPTTPELFGNSNAFNTPKENSVSDEKQTNIFKIGLLGSTPYTPSEPRLSIDFCSTGRIPRFGSAATEMLGEQVTSGKEIGLTKDNVAAEEPPRGNGHTKQEAPPQSESCISADEDWETAEEE